MTAKNVEKSVKSQERSGQLTTDVERDGQKKPDTEQGVLREGTLADWRGVVIHPASPGLVIELKITIGSTDAQTRIAELGSERTASLAQGTQREGTLADWRGGEQTESAQEKTPPRSGDKTRSKEASDTLRGGSPR